ncbi:MAG: hypothetical protein JWO82_845 [Akkermansiaceae bacterium]|nr:hypothetical protein [Akkermansiaceae bacterium]
MKRLFFIPAFLSAALPCSALVVRDFDPAVHFRLNDFPGFTPSLNPGFLYDASRFTGVGYATQAAYLQFTLVTPRHFLCANHTGAKPAVGDVVGFIGKDNVTYTRTITALTNIANDTGGNSDLVVGTLESAVPVAVVVPLPWLNLTPQNSYRGISLMVLGMIGRGGAAKLEDFQTINEAGAIDNTFMSYFAYTEAAGDANDCHFEGGDSGSPTFGTASNGEPALVGTHSTVGSLPDDINPVTTYSYDTFLPHYVTRVDTFLSAAGYRVRPANASATAVVLTSAATPASPLQAHGGSVNFTVANTGAALTGNLELTLSFPAGAVPDSVTMPGWVVESTGAGTWSLRKATLAAGANGVATATWASFPVVPQIAIATTLDSDATVVVTGQTTLTLRPSYAAWAQGLTAAGQADDPDGDGVVNLLEYALGGDPAVSSPSLPGGQGRLLPQVVTADGSSIDFSYPERTDATARGLSYRVEISSTLLPDSWTTVLPDGNTSTTAPFDPVLGGFQLRQVTWPVGTGTLFVRLRVELNESP